MTDQELSELNIKDLNRKLKEKGLPKQIIEKLKQRRRTLKNRKYATERDFELWFLLFLQFGYHRPIGRCWLPMEVYSFLQFG